MASKLTKEIICTKCGAKEKSLMHIGINVSEDPQMKNEILNQTIFDKVCPSCGYSRQIAYPVVYHDPKKRYMIALTPAAGKASTIKAPKHITEIVKRRVKSLEELKEKIFIFDSNLNDVAVEMVKNSICDAIREQNKSNKNKAYFSKIADDNSLEFAIFLDGSKKPIYYKSASSVYESFEQLANSVFVEDGQEFLRVGPTLVRKLFDKK